MQTPTTRRFASALCLLACAALPPFPQADAGPARKAPPAARSPQQSESIQRLKQMAVMLEMSVQDGDGVYPPMKTPAQAQKSLMPYARQYGTLAPHARRFGQTVFLQPGTGRPYLPNPLLSGRRETSVKPRADIMTFYEPVPADDGSRLLTTADGRVHRLSASNWAGYKRALHLP